MTQQKIALVTGGNRGIGLATVEGLVKSGFQVILGSRRLESGKLALEYLEEYGEEIDLMQLDVRDDENVRKAAKYVNKTYGKLDVLVNNAGIIGKSKESLSTSDLSDIKDVMETNYYGPMRMSKAFLPLLQKAEGARIINVSSGMGALGDLFGGYAGYRMSKAGLNAQTIMLSNDLHGLGIKVFAMCPGWVRTEMGGAEAQRTPDQGADTIIWLANSPDAITGKMYRDRMVISW